MKIDIIELAPWVAIAVTLILSILIPLFTQIANNHFQLKKSKQDRALDAEKEKLSKKREAYERFLSDVGRTIQFSSNENISVAGASIGRLYLYVPAEWHTQLDELYHSIREYKWTDAEKQYTDLAKLITDEYQEIDNKQAKKK